VEAIRERGAELWVVSPDKVERLRRFQEEEGIDFPILVDPGNRVSASWGLVNEQNPVVPHPTTAILDRQGVIRYLRVDTDYKVRPSVGELLEALDELDK
jgi:peroxiredoxin